VDYPFGSGEERALIRSLLSLCVAAALLGSVVVGHATGLSVNAGVLQTAQIEQSPSRPLVIANRIYSGATDNLNRVVEHGPYWIAPGTEYELEWTEGTRDCPSGTRAPHGTGGPFTSTAVAHHNVCSRTNQAAGLPVVSVNGETIEPSR
jgi:hypothetical protein